MGGDEDGPQLVFKLVVRPQLLRKSFTRGNCTFVLRTNFQKLVLNKKNATLTQKYKILVLRTNFG